MKNGIIYLARNKINQKGYVGQTTWSLEARKAQHLCSAYRTVENYGYKFCHPFACAIRKYGWNSFEWRIVCEIPEVNLDLFEIWFIAQLDTYSGDGKGYNATYGGKVSPMHNPTIVDKMAKTKRGRQSSVETKRKMSIATRGEKNSFFGKHHSEETKKKIAVANGGKNSPWLGRKHTAEEKMKISAGNSGKPKSEAHRKKLSESKIGEKGCNFGKVFSEEVTHKMSIAQSGEKHHMFGKHHSKESKEKIKNSPRLTTEQRHSIFEMHRDKIYDIGQLALMFGLSKQTIYHIIGKIRRAGTA